MTFSIFKPINFKNLIKQGRVVDKEYPHWVMIIAFCMIGAGILPMPFVYLLRRFQLLKVDLDIHQGSIRRNETTASTKEMIDQDDDVSASMYILFLHNLLFKPHFERSYMLLT
jgi:hypothetical protein